MANDWLRATRITTGTIAAREVTAETLHADEIQHDTIRASVLYPQFLDAGSRPVEDRDDDW